MVDRTELLEKLKEPVKAAILFFDKDAKFVSNFDEIFPEVFDEEEFSNEFLEELEYQDILELYWTCMFNELIVEE